MKRAWVPGSGWKFARGILIILGRKWNDHQRHLLVCRHEQITELVSTDVYSPGDIKNIFLILKTQTSGIWTPAPSIAYIGETSHSVRVSIEAQFTRGIEPPREFEKVFRVENSKDTGAIYWPWMQSRPWQFPQSFRCPHHKLILATGMAECRRWDMDTSAIYCLAMYFNNYKARNASVREDGRRSFLVFIDLTGQWIFGALVQGWKRRMFIPPFCFPLLKLRTSAIYRHLVWANYFVPFLLHPFPSC